MDFKEKIRRHWKAIALIAVCLTAGAIIPTRFAVTMTPSLENRIFFITSRYGEESHKGDFVLIELAKLNPPGGMPSEIKTALEKAREKTIIKRIACECGSYLNNYGLSYICDGEFIGEAKEKTLGGQKTLPFQYAGRIPPGYIFVTGDHQDSYDSRYFGLVQQKDVIAILHPLF